jgi:hypothetical protein
LLIHDIECYSHKDAIFCRKYMFTTTIFSCFLSAIFQPIFIAKIDVDLVNKFRSLSADLDVSFADINCHIILQIRDNNINFLIQLTYIIAKCLFFCLGKVQSSREVLYLWGNDYLTYTKYLLTFHPT